MVKFNYSDAGLVFDACYLVLFPVFVAGGAQKVRVKRRTPAALLLAVEHDRIVLIVRVLALALDSIGRDVKVSTPRKPKLTFKIETKS
jgi:hypothetical protein